MTEQEVVAYDQADEIVCFGFPSTEINAIISVMTAWFDGGESNSVDFIHLLCYLKSKSYYSVEFRCFLSIDLYYIKKTCYICKYCLIINNTEDYECRVY